MQGQGGPGGWWRQQLANLYGLLAISMMMFDGREADDIVRLAVTTVPSLNAGEVVAVYVVADGRLEPVPRGPVPDPELDRHVRDLGEAGGEIVLADGMWRWAYPLTGLGAGIGRLVVKASRGPSPDEFFLLRALGQQLSAALANASMHRCERVGCHKSATNADQQLQAASSCSLIRLQARGAPGARAHTQQEQEQNRSDMHTRTALSRRQLTATDPHHAADSLFPQVSSMIGRYWGSRGRRFKSCRPDGQNKARRHWETSRSTGLFRTRMTILPRPSTVASTKIKPAKQERNRSVDPNF
ncbi:hypothetical protein [Kutzneria albida]|uniref:GAF domain-containing protein n=1 Tax=Kutzneria albida DSM 43870 TaxID=1449976 RepID=W5WCZ0_9PSEU|nr:hypothetical protein [Kutzneria albida]AHH98707.1 hypothetical protein KALB_5345 [Kutzneria albida DSM 43870]